MINKPALLIILFLSAETSLFAQTSLGIEGGLSYNTYHTNIDNRTSTTLAGGTGFNLSIPLRYRIYPWLYVIATPGLVQKAYSLNRTDSLSGEYDRHDNAYFQLPIGVGLMRSWRRLRVGLDFGLYAGYWLYGRVEGRTANIFGNATDNNSEQFGLSGYDASYSFDARRDNRWEEGWWLGPALQYRLGASWWLTARATYYGALTSQEKAPVSPIPAYNRTWIFSIGGTWSLPHSTSHP